MLRTIACLALFAMPCSSDSIIVSTSRGIVEGFDHDFGSDTSQPFYGYGQMFLGIPFAKPPLGDLRFALPEDICEYNNSGEVHNATYCRPMCYQKKNNVAMSEDCLYLNVMTPNISGNFPVMVYIHGGTLTTGSASDYHWKGAVRNLVSRGVVVVTIQYRLGLLGFFTTYTETFSPNRGMYDQIVALRWVKEEIANFGGDPDKVTIFGQSSGAASVSDLSLSPLARGLFHQLIQSSGSALTQMETRDDFRGSIHQDRARQICQINSTDWGSHKKDQAILDCLLDATPQQLVAFDWSDSKFWNVGIDGAFMPDTPDVMAQTRPHYPVVFGDMADDAGWLTLNNGDISNLNADSVQTVLQNSWPYDNATANDISDIAIFGYSNGTIPADEDHLAWAKLSTDIFTGLVYSSLSQRDMQWHQATGNNDVWLFTFALRSLLPNGLEIDGWIPVTHGAELPYLWFYPSVWETYNATVEDFAAADLLGKLWTDFAKNGNLPYARAETAMNYIEITDSFTPQINWRQDADEVFNHQLPTDSIDFPPLPMTNETIADMKTLGEKVSLKWNSLKCASRATTVGGTSLLTGLWAVLLRSWQQ